VKGLKPVEASLVADNPELSKLFVNSGGVLVNDVFLPLWDDVTKVLLLYGGYGSGKSVFIVDKLLNKCLTAPYFRCFYGRKIHDTVRISVFATLCDRIEELKLQHLFIYSKADNSSMVIRCRENGNSFNPFGADNADKLKSVKDPSHIFCEEFDQFSEKDFGVLVSRLRTEKVATQFIGAFNTTTVTDTHWIKQAFFGERKKFDYPIKALFCNYTDNYFINKKEYEQTLWIAAAFNETKFREISAGEWGSEQKDNLFIYSLREKERKDLRPGYCHVVEGMTVDYSLPVILSFDFNVDPITCLVIQHATNLSWVSVIQEYRLLNSDIFELTERIANDHPGAYFIVVGDASGKNRTAITRGNKNYYYFIKEQLKTNNFKLLSKNPSVANQRALTNIVLTKHPAYLINKTCNFLIEDITNVVTDEEGAMDQKKDKHRSHLLACLLYYNYVFHYNFLKLLRK
jgi:phage terminase large subunit